MTYLNWPKKVCDLIAKSLDLLDENVGNYFPSLVDTTLFDWTRNRFIDNDYDNAQLITVEEHDLSDIRNDRGLKLEYKKQAQDAEDRIKRD